MKRIFGERRWGAVCAALIMAGAFLISFLKISWVVSADAVEAFELLGEKEEGISYLKDPCHKNMFTLVFSFSQDIQDPPKQELAFVELSSEFQDLMRSLDEDLSYISLYYSGAKKIGNRQIEVTYVAKKILLNGADSDVDLPDQIEVNVLDGDLEKVLDVFNRRCQFSDLSKKKATLINKYADQKCFE